MDSSYEIDNCEDISAEYVHDRVVYYLAVYGWDFDWKRYVEQYMKNNGIDSNVERALYDFRRHRGKMPLGEALNRYIDGLSEEETNEFFEDFTKEVILYEPNAKDIVETIFGYPIWNCEDEYGSFHYIIDYSLVEFFELILNSTDWNELLKTIGFYAMQNEITHKHPKPL